jgi:hypothetical protein
MKFRIGLNLVALLLVTCLIFTPVVSASSSWFEYPTNPVYSTGSKAYYPYVLYDADAFSHHGDTYYYKMWYSTGSTVKLAYSNDGVNWVAQSSSDLNTLTTPNHPVVIYSASGFGGGIYYKIWYWNSASEYTDPIRCAESSDGITWVNDQAITQDPSAKLVEGWVSPYWFYSSYGPSAVLYNPTGYSSINTIDPMENKYVMYYDAASQGYAPDGTTEATALAVSVDGIYWSRIGTEPVLKASGGSSWDSGYAYAWSVLKIGGIYYMYYSGGKAASNEGIGYAESTDGITWTKQASPLMHISDGIAWRSSRTYTPCVVYDSNSFSGHGDSSYLKMWYTGVSGSNYAIGYAYMPMTLSTPEYPIGAFAGVIACAAAVSIFRLRKKEPSVIVC